MSFFIAVICVFDKQPGAVYGVFSASLDIPCVTNTEPILFFWYRGTDGEVGNTIATESGVNPPYRDQYDLITDGNKDFTLRIKSVGWSELQLSCQVYVDNHNGGYDQYKSSASNITTVGKYIRLRV